MRITLFPFFLNLSPTNASGSLHSNILQSVTGVIIKSFLTCALYILYVVCSISDVPSASIISLRTELLTFFSISPPLISFECMSYVSLALLRNWSEFNHHSCTAPFFLTPGFIFLVPNFNRIGLTFFDLCTPLPSNRVLFT